MFSMAPGYTVDGVTVYYAGERDSPLKSKKGKPVRIDDIRKAHNKSNPYEDADFPADSGSIGAVGGDWAASSGKAAKSYVWVRPAELCKAAGVKKPEFAVAQDKLASTELCSEYDLRQGGLGDCWYLAALAALTKRPDQLEFVIPADNYHGFDDGKYCGAFHFRFYSLYHCKWVDIVVDDRLPAVSKKGVMTPAFTKIISTDKATLAEFWPALIEKAYAKFIGSYAKIEGGFTSQALEDFTNGFSEIIDLVQPSDTYTKLQALRSVTKYEFFVDKVNRLQQYRNFCGLDTFDLEGAQRNGVLDGYSDYKDKTGADGKTVHKLTGYKYNQAKDSIEKDPTSTGKGLCQGHAYTILSAEEFKTKDGKGTHLLLKVKNPHATHEWDGKYSDKDDKSWAKLAKDGRAKAQTAGKGCHSKDVDEGIFWIDLHDALKYFSNFETCVFGMQDGTKFVYVQSEWPAALQTRATKFARSDLHYFTAYKFEVKRELLNIDIPREYGNRCLAAWTIVIAGYYSGMEPELRFSYYMYQVTDADLAKPLSELYKKKKAFDTGSGNVGREESKWGVLEPGQYLIVPFIKTAPSAVKSIPKEYLGKPIPYTLRLFTENVTKLEAIPPKA